MEDFIPGGCIEIWRKEPFDKLFKEVLVKYAVYLNAVSTSYTIRFMKPIIQTKEVERQIIKAIGYVPIEEIVICGFSNIIFDSAYEIMLKFGGYLKAGVTRPLIPKTNGKAFQIKYYDIIGSTKIPRYYHLLDKEFTKNYFAVGRDRALQDICSLNEYTIHGVRINDIINRLTDN